jgi:hypothetical protein
MLIPKTLSCHKPLLIMSITDFKLKMRSFNLFFKLSDKRKSEFVPSEEKLSSGNGTYFEPIIMQMRSSYCSTPSRVNRRRREETFLLYISSTFDFTHSDTANIQFVDSRQK